MATKMQSYSELANQILNQNTDYFNDKQIIKKIFAINGIDHQETIRIRLTIIDSFYSTNMSRRYYGIHNISKEIADHYTDDQYFINDLIEFTNEPYNNDDIINLFNTSYGISKFGKPIGKAISLISKYAYFLTNFHFPIYDSIVFETYPRIVNIFHQGELEKDLPNDISGFVRNMNRLNNVSGLYDFNRLDNLLWLIGKILRGNLSLILNEKTYSIIVKQINPNPHIKSSEVDAIIKKYVFSNLENLKHLISNDLFSMISFVKEIENITN
jgi:hypothetical protein